MGAQPFTNRAAILAGERPSEGDVKDVFARIRDTALYNHGHGGYTGTIAEKHEFRIIDFESETEASAFLNDFDSWPDWMDDKWGPAGALRYPGGVLFAGWASC